MSRQIKLEVALERISVVAGIIRKANDTVLISNRQNAVTLKDYWEFPGGKIVSGESSESALQRELHEELGIDVLSAQYICHIEHDYPCLKVGIAFYLVTNWRGNPISVEGQQIKWVKSATLDKQNLLPADAPVIKILSRMKL
ncbi:MAG: 8-oxo-dGTP diphosphatase MutT [Woeseia sp.]|nr:8-oxo-dGTP diphosphatase MutT [Woeseia sp.]